VLKESNLVTTEIGDEDELFNIHVRQTNEKTDMQGIKTQDTSTLARKNLRDSVMYSKKNYLMRYHRKEEMVTRSFWNKDTSLHPGHLQE